MFLPKFVKNLISVQKFAIDNWCSIEFDHFGFSVKDLQSRKTILRSESSGELYPLPPPLNNSQHTAFVCETPTLWHKRFAHANNETLKSVLSSASIRCNKDSLPICNACQLGKHLKKPFLDSTTKSLNTFDLVHTDVWTSSLASLSGIRYYVLFLDDYSHYVWVYPLRNKSDVFAKFLHFSAYVERQFQKKIKALQCDNGGGVGIQ